MLPELQQKIQAALATAVEGILPGSNPVIKLERPKQPEHGDIATNVAMQLAKPNKRNPRELAQEIVNALLGNEDTKSFLAAAEIAGRGFI